MDKSQSEKEYVKAALEYRDIMQKAIDRRSRGVVVDPVSGKERPASAASAPAAGNSSGNWVLKPGADPNSGRPTRKHHNGEKRTLGNS